MTPLTPRNQIAITRASFLLLLAATPACGLIEKLTGKKKKTESEFAAVEPIPFQKLVSLLPKMEGWGMKPPEGEIMDVGGERLSFARGQYEKTTGELKLSMSLEILDGVYGSAAYAPFAALAHSGGNMENPHRMPVKLPDTSGMEEWNPEARAVRVLLLVARRFVVTIKGTNVTQPVVNQFLHALDLKKLASFTEGDAHHQMP